MEESSITLPLLLLLLLISMLSIASSTSPILEQPQCGSCSKSPKTPIVKPPITLPPAVPIVPVPPITVPQVPAPPVNVPKVPVPTVPIIGPPRGKGCPPPAGKRAGAGASSCPIDTLKLGACVDVLGGMVHVGLGGPAEHECCPVISGLAELEAAVCLCTTLKIKALDLNVYVPLALQLLITCGKTPPPGYTCSL